MPAYTYDGLNKQGQTVHGEVVADNNAQAVNKLREAGVIVTEIKEKGGKAQKSRGRGKKVTTTEVAILCRQLSVMLSAGVPITRALTTLSKQTENARLADAVDEVAKSVEGGMPLSDAFAQYPKIFSKLFIAMISAGETGGILEQSLRSLSDQLEKERTLQKNIKAAYSYPKNVGIMAFLILIAMLVFMVPTFEKMMPKKDNLNALSAFIFSVSESLRTQPLIWIGVGLAIVVTIVIIVKSPPAHRFWENTKLTMPIFGTFITKMVVARFCRTLATLLAGGVTAVDALKSAGPTSGSDKMAKAVEDAISDIEEGNRISDSLDRSGLFPALVTGMIAIGEESGTLPEMLDKVAEFYEEDVDAMSRNLRAKMEPIALVIVGIIVGGMLIALYVPMLTASISIGAE